MCTHNVCFHGEIRKKNSFLIVKSVVSRDKKSKKYTYLFCTVNLLYTNHYENTPIQIY